MKIKLNYKIKKHDDSVILEGENISEIRDKANAFFKSRGLIGMKVVTGQEVLEE